MKRYVMTARRKAALRKAQLASARKRRGLTRKGMKNFGKAVRNHPVKAGLLFGGAVVAGNLTGNYMRNYINDRITAREIQKILSRYATESQPYAPGMRALPRRVRALGPSPGPGRRSQVNLNRTRNPKSPYYQSRYDRGQKILTRASRQSPPLRKNNTVYSVNSTGEITLRFRKNK